MGLPSAEPMPSNSKNVAKKESDQIEDYFVLDMRNIQSCVATYLKITKNLCNSKIKPTYLEDFKCCKLWCLILMWSACHKKRYLLCVELTNFGIFTKPFPIGRQPHRAETADFRFQISNFEIRQIAFLMTCRPH